VAVHPPRAHTVPGPPTFRIGCKPKDQLVQSVKDLGVALENAENGTDKKHRSIKGKFHLIRETLMGEKFDENDAPFRDFSLLIDVRNALAHHKALDEITDSLEFVDQRQRRPSDPTPTLQNGLAATLKGQGGTGDVFINRISTVEVARWSCNTATSMVKAVIEMVPDADLQRLLTIDYSRDFFKEITSLDTFLSDYHFSEKHSIGIAATPARIMDAIRDLALADVPLARPLFAIRALPGRLSGRDSGRDAAAALAGARPLWQQMLDGRFVLLEEVLNREVVIGTIGQFWKITGDASSLASRPSTAQEFLDFNDPEYAKAALNFSLAEGPSDGRTTLRTETRIYIPDYAVRKKFAAYWRVIYLGSALFRRSWLKAIKRRAEQESSS